MQPGLDATIARCFGLSELSSITIGIVGRSQTELGAETDGIVAPLVRVRIVDPVSGANDEDSSINAGGQCRALPNPTNTHDCAVRGQRDECPGWL